MIVLYSPDGSSEGVAILQAHSCCPLKVHQQQWIGCDTLSPMFMNGQIRDLVFITAVQWLFSQFNVVDTQIVELAS